MADDDKFQLVCSRKRGKRLPSVIGNHNSRENNIADSDFDVDKLSRKLNEAKDELNASDYIKAVYQALEKTLELLKPATRINNLICYGLGHFSEHKHSRYQLALLLLIRDYLKSQVHVYDPLFFTQETRFLESLDFSIIEKNEEGKRRVESTTLIYMPHCPKQLTNNFLHANWGLGLKNCVLLCNSFSRILESHTDKILHKTARYILSANKFVQEINLPNNFADKNVFSDSALHVFTQDKLEQVSQSVWEDKEEPKYLEADIEFVANSFTRKLML